MTRRGDVTFPELLWPLIICKTDGVCCVLAAESGADGGEPARFTWSSRESVRHDGCEQFAQDCLLCSVQSRELARENLRGLRGVRVSR